MPLRSSILKYQHFFSAIDELLETTPVAEIILLGHFNLPSLFLYNNSLPISCPSEIESYFLSILSYFNLNKFNCIYNYNNVMLDLFLSNTMSPLPLTQILYITHQ